MDSNHRSKLQQIYSLSPLATRESAHLSQNNIKLICFTLQLLESWKPMIGLEPITCWLQISCSANWATSAYIISWFVISCSAYNWLVSRQLSRNEPHRHKKWKLQGSNLWPSACKADALPAELRSHIERPKRDSNPRPPPWQGGALTNWAIRPLKVLYLRMQHLYIQNFIQIPSLLVKPSID